MTHVLYREGEDYQVVDVEFSINGCAKWLQLSPEDLVADPNNENDATAVTVFVTNDILNLTVVTFFNSEGESKQFTGSSTEFSN